MIVGRMAKYPLIVLSLLAILALSSLVMGMNVPPSAQPTATKAGDARPDSDLSVTCVPFGLHGDIITPPLVGSLNDSGDNLTFVGTTDGFYVVAPGGKLQHFLYSPFGVRHIALIDDTTGDGIREVVVALNDTQVPALRCYDGATWKKLWQFAPMARIWDRLWVDRQLTVTGLETMSGEKGQRLVITSGRSLFALDARDGSVEWRFTASSAVSRMVTLADLNGDDADEVFAGSDDGDLFCLSGRTGGVEWQTALPRHKGATYDVLAPLVRGITTLGGESGRIMVASIDGWAQMYDLREKRRDWEARVFGDDSTEGYYGDYNWYLSPTPDITGDGLPEVLMTRMFGYSEYQFTAYTDAKAALCSSAGEILWEEDTTACGGLGLQADAFEGSPAFIEMDGQEIRLIDLEDGRSVLHTLTLSAASGVIARQPEGGGYLAFSSGGDLAAISPSGELLWDYPRLGRVTSETGDFVGDSTPDVLFRGFSFIDSQYGKIPIMSKSEDGITIHEMTPGDTSAQEATVRVLGMMDGATRAITWSCDVSQNELGSVAGLEGIQVTPDLVGADGTPDIIGYRGDTVFVFSGKNGALSSLPVGQPIVSLEVMRNGTSGNAIAAGIAGGLSVFDSAGNLLWTTSSAEWLGGGGSGQPQRSASGERFMVLDDINSDNVSDLAITSAAKIAVLKSVAATTNYELHLTFNAEAHYTISYTEVVPDADNDGIRDLAYMQTGQPTQQGEEFVQPPNPLLSKKSPVDGKELFTVRLPASWFQSKDLVCGDFNSDGCADSLFTCYGHGSDKLESPGAVVSLVMLSGKDGTTLRTHAIDANSYRGMLAGDTPVAVNIGDVDGDAADDLAYTSSPSGCYEYMPDGGYSYTPPEDMQLSVHVYSPAQDSILKSVPATFHLNYFGEWNPSQVAIDVDGDGCLELVSNVTETDTSSYGDESSSYYRSSRQYIAVVDVQEGRRLAGFTGFDVTTSSLFDTHQPGTLGVAACGGACFLRVDADVQVASPEDGAETTPVVGVTWRGHSDGDFCQVFVDGVSNRITNGMGVDLYLSHGYHEVVVRSIDECGRISYGPADLATPVAITVAASPWKPAWLMLGLFALLFAVLLLFYARLHRALRARRRVAR